MTIVGAPYTPPLGGGPVVTPGKVLECSTPASPVRHPPNLIAVDNGDDGWTVDHCDGIGNRWGICECGHRESEEALACARALLDNVGRKAFETYNHCVGGVTWNGLPIPGWDAVTDHVRDGWRMAALSVRAGQVIR